MPEACSLDLSSRALRMLSCAWDRSTNCLWRVWLSSFPNLHFYSTRASSFSRSLILVPSSSCISFRPNLWLASIYSRTWISWASLVWSSSTFSELLDPILSNFSVNSLTSFVASTSFYSSDRFWLINFDCSIFAPSSTCANYEDASNSFSYYSSNFRVSSCFISSNLIWIYLMESPAFF